MQTFKKKTKLVRLVSMVMLTVFCVIFLASCGSSEAPPKPDDFSLEFWILDNVDDTDLTPFFSMPGRFGCIEILGSNYTAVLNEENEYDYPEYYVSYILTAYPDYASEGLFVTQIIVTDPAVTLYGLTINSTVEEFDAVFSEMGFELSNLEFHENIRVAEKGKISVRFLQGNTLSFMAKVTNETGIMF